MARSHAEADFKDWGRYALEIKGMANTLPEAQTIFLEGLGSKIVAGVRMDYGNVPLIGNTRPMAFSGEYGRSFNYVSLRGEPRGVGVGFSSQGRLPIYWRAMETGSIPAGLGSTTLGAWSQATAGMRLAFSNIWNWANTKVGINPAWVYKSISRDGVRRQGLLARYFLFASPRKAVVVGITSLVRAIIEKELSQFTYRWSANWGKGGVGKYTQYRPGYRGFGRMM